MTMLLKSMSNSQAVLLELSKVKFIVVISIELDS
jgi:hypothetical protein